MAQAKRHALSTLVVAFYAVQLVATSTVPPPTPRSSKGASSPDAPRPLVTLEPGVVQRGTLADSDPEVYFSPADAYRLSLRAGRVYTIDVRPAGWEKYMPCFLGAPQEIHLAYDLFEGTLRDASLRALTRFLEPRPRSVSTRDSLGFGGVVLRSRVRPARTGDHVLLVYAQYPVFADEVSRPMVGDYELRLYDRAMPLRGTNDACRLALPPP